MDKEYHKRYSRMLYDDCIKNKICTQCKKSPAVSGKTKCEDCAKKHKVFLEDYESREQQKVRRLEMAKALREERKKNGLCTKCGAVPERNGRSYCDNCLEATKKRIAKSKSLKKQ